MGRSRSASGAPSGHLDRVSHFVAEVLAQPPRQALLELTHALAGDPESIAQLLQRQWFVRHEPLVEDRELFLLTGERLPERGQLLLDEALELAVREQRFRS